MSDIYTPREMLEKLVAFPTVSPKDLPCVPEFAIAIRTVKGLLTKVNRCFVRER